LLCCRSYPGEKRRKQTQATLTYLLEETDINDDLRIINKTLAQAKQPASPATQSAGKDRSVAVVMILWFLAVFRIHDILVWIRIRGSMPLTNGSGSGFGSGSLSFYFH
jgi:hypothetical protein